MASSFDDEMGSLFEGMVLFNPTEEIPQQDNPPQPPPSPEEDNPPRQQDPSLPPPPPPSLPVTPPPPPLQSLSSEPLDENLFSDLTLTTPNDNLTFQSPPDLSSTPEKTTTSSITRQISTRRKKKAGIRIGYGRDTSLPEDQPSPSPSPSPSLSPSTSLPSITESQSPPLPSHSDSLPPPQSDPHPSELPSQPSTIVKASSTDNITEEKTTTSQVAQEDFIAQPSSPPQVAQEPQLIAQPSLPPPQEESTTVAEKIEQKLDKIRTEIQDKLKGIREMAASVSANRKESSRKRRKAAENVNLATFKYKELEKDLEEACETEDFERAETLSDSLATVEKEKQVFLSELRDAEAQCDSVDSNMQEVLEMMIQAEEHGISLFQQFAKDAADNVNLVLKNAEEFSSKEMSEWMSSVEALELRRMELEIESHLINDARLGLSDTIEHTVEDDKREKEILCKKREVLMEELENLLALVRQKEAEIAENDTNIEEVEKRISGAVSGFHEMQSDIDTKYHDLQSVLSRIDLEGKHLSTKKKEIDDFISQEENRVARLNELISVAMDEAKACQELIALRKSLALPILKYREVKVRLAKTEEKILEDVQSLRQDASSARASLQEFSSARSSIQQEIASAKQRIFFIDKRSPELEAEKKVAAAARNFKEAGRIAAEVKTLGVEKESIQTKMEADILQLQRMEEQISDTVKRLNEMEELILVKEKDAAIAGCERQHLVAAAAMAERSAALELGDVEEAITLRVEAEAADFEAIKFQQAYNLKDEEFESISKHLISIDLIANLGREQLVKMAVSISLPVE